MKVYLETTIINFLFADDAPEKKEVTERLFYEIKEGKHEAYVSSTVALEIARASSPKRELLEKVIEEYELPIWEVTEQMRELGKRYVDEGIFPQKYAADALHVAVAVMNRCDVLVSWNFEHIVRAKTIIRVGEINRRLGLPEVIICSPEEVIDYEERA